MPTTYAHYRLGNEVIGLLPESARKTALACRELFDIGVHGPDLFFYHNPVVKSPLVRMGESMHHESAAAFFTKAADIVRGLEDPEAHKAYLYGFLCHFALDRTCHGYIEERVRKTGVSHFEIEAELDRELLIKDGRDPVSAHLTGHLNPSLENAEVIADFFAQADPYKIKTTIKRMIFFLDMLCVPDRKKRKRLFFLMKAVKLYDSLHGLVINYEENPKSRETTDWLLSAYPSAVSEAVLLITEYGEYLEKGGGLSELFYYDFESDRKEKEMIHGTI